jgi:hypothetical protein
MYTIQNGKPVKVNTQSIENYRYRHHKRRGYGIGHVLVSLLVLIALITMIFFIIKAINNQTPTESRPSFKFF